jgi:hypothetical protein
MSRLRLIVDLDRRTLSPIFSGFVGSTAPVLSRGDVVPVEIIVTQSTDQAEFGIDDLELEPGESLGLEIGVRGSKPIAGSFRLAYSTSVSDPIPANPTTAEVQAAVASVVPPGTTVSVSSFNSGFLVKFSPVGDYQLLSAVDVGLIPTSTVVRVEAVQGDGDTNERQVIRIGTAPIAKATGITTLDPASVSLSSIAPFNGEISITRLSIANAKGGEIVVSFTPLATGIPASFNAPHSVSATALSDYLSGIGVVVESVSTVAPGVFDIYCATEPDAIGTNGFEVESSLLTLNAYRGEFDLTNASVFESLVSVTSLAVSLDIILSRPEGDDSISSSQATLRSDLILN